jgi:hypothetical protein
MRSNGKNFISSPGNPTAGVLIIKLTADKFSKYSSSA